MENGELVCQPLELFGEVRKDFSLPEKVRIHDVTLRDGEQQAGIIFTKDDKIRIAEKLSEVGVHRIEAGVPAVSPPEEAAILFPVPREDIPNLTGASRSAACQSKLLVYPTKSEMI